MVQIDSHSRQQHENFAQRMVGFQSTPTSVGRSLWIRSCGAQNCSRRATVMVKVRVRETNAIVCIVEHYTKPVQTTIL